MTSNRRGVNPKTYICIVLYCTVLYCIVLYGTVLHCTPLHYAALHWAGRYAQLNTEPKLQLLLCTAFLFSTQSSISELCRASFKAPIQTTGPLSSCTMYARTGLFAVMKGSVAQRRQFQHMNISFIINFSLIFSSMQFTLCRHYIKN